MPFCSTFGNPPLNDAFKRNIQKALFNDPTPIDLSDICQTESKGGLGKIMTNNQDFKDLFIPNAKVNADSLARAKKIARSYSNKQKKTLLCALLSRYDFTFLPSLISLLKLFSNCEELINKIDQVTKRALDKVGDRPFKEYENKRSEIINEYSNSLEAIQRDFFKEGQATALDIRSRNTRAYFPLSLYNDGRYTYPQLLNSSSASSSFERVGDIEFEANAHELISSTAKHKGCTCTFLSWPHERQNFFAQLIDGIQNRQIGMYIPRIVNNRMWPDRTYPSRQHSNRLDYVTPFSYSYYRYQQDDRATFECIDKFLQKNKEKISPCNWMDDLEFSMNNGYNAPLYKSKTTGDYWVFGWHLTQNMIMRNSENFEFNGGILHSGFDIKFAKDGLYGPGFYIAINSCKSLQYGDLQKGCSLLFVAGNLGKDPVLVEEDWYTDYQDKRGKIIPVNPSTTSDRRNHYEFIVMVPPTVLFYFKRPDT